MKKICTKLFDKMHVSFVLTFFSLFIQTNFFVGICCEKYDLYCTVFACLKIHRKLLNHQVLAKNKQKQ